MKPLRLMILCLAVWTALPADAAFKMKPAGCTTGARTDANAGTALISRISTHHPGPATPATAPRPESLWNNVSGIVSLLAGITGGVIGALLAIDIIIWSPAVAVIGLFAALAAFFLGIRGKKRRPRGFAIAGYVLGLVELGLAATLLLAIGIVLLALSV